MAAFRDQDRVDPRDVEVRIALDSNRYTDLCRNVPEVVAVVEEAVEVWLPFAVLAEGLAGFSLGQRGSENERTLTRFLRQPGVDALFADDATTHHYASLLSAASQPGNADSPPTTCGLPPSCSSTT